MIVQGNLRAETNFATFRALILVQGGVQEIDKTQLRDSVSCLKQRTVSQLQSLREGEEETAGENIDLRKTTDSRRRSSEEKRKSLEERSHPSTSATEEAKGEILP